MTNCEFCSEPAILGEIFCDACRIALEKGLEDETNDVRREQQANAIPD